MNSLNNYFYRLNESKTILIILFFIDVLILISRRPDSIFSPQPWAEDGFLYIQSVVYHPWVNIIFLYGDYFFFIPRIITNIAVSLNLVYAPLIMNVVTFGIISICAVYFSTKDFRFIIQNDLLRIFCSLFVVLLPAASVASNEDYTLENIGWFLTLFAVLFSAYVLFKYDNYVLKSKLKKSFYVIFCSLIFLTAPATFILFPVFIYVILRELRKDRSKIRSTLPFFLLSTILVFHASIFYYVYTHIDNLHPLDQKDFSIETDIKSFVNIFTINVARTLYHDTNFLATTLGDFIYLIPIGFLSIILLNSQKKINKIDFFLMTFASLELILAMIFREGFLLQYSSLSTSFINDRYFIPPTIIVFILLIRQLQERKSYVLRIILIIILGIIVYNIVTGFSMVALADFNYQSIAKMYNKQSNELCLIPINPSANYRDLLIPCSDPEPNWKGLKQINGTGKISVHYVIDNNYDPNFQIKTTDQDLETIFQPLPEYNPILMKYDYRPPVLEGGLENESADAEVYLLFSNHDDNITIHASKMIGHDPFDFSKFSNMDYKWRAVLNPKQFKNGCYEIKPIIFLKNKNTYYEIPEHKQLCLTFLRIM